MKYSVILFLLLFIYTGCTKTDSDDLPEHLDGIQNLTMYDSDEITQYDIEFNRTHVFEESDDLMFGRISGVAVDESERVYISEVSRGHTAMHVFNADGSYLRSIGGYGDGPGEFRSAINPQIYDGNLYTLDGLALKINVYSSNTFAFEKSILLDPRNWIHIQELGGSSVFDFTVINSNRILLSFIKSEGRKDLLFRYIINGSGEIISDKILKQVNAEHFVLPGNSRVFYSPYSANGLMVISDDQELYTIWTEEILFKKHTINGEYESAFYHPFSNKELNRSEVLNYIDNEEYRAAVRNSGIPDFWPAVHSVVMDDMNNLWISTIIDSEDEYQWWILNSSEGILSKFNWPKSKRIQVIKNESVFAIETDPESGIQKVVKYQFKLN